MKKFLSIVLALMLICLCFAGCGSNSEKTDLEYIQDKGELVIGITYFAPMNYLDDNNELVGFETEFAKAVCEELGVEAEFQEINWSTKENELNSKNIDCIWNGMTIDEERKANMSVTDPYMNNKQVLVVKAENADKYTTAEALNGLTIVAEAESAGETVITENAVFANSNYTAVDSMATALFEVFSGTADGCVVDYVTSIGMIGEGTDYAGLSVVNNLAFSEEQYGIAFRKGSDVTAKVNEIIDTLVQNGKLEEIAKTYKLEAQIVK